jgi:hypothetical protein
VVSSHLGDHLLVALDAPVGADVVPVDEAPFLLLRLRVRDTRCEGPQNKLPGDIHLLLNGDIISPEYSINPLLSSVVSFVLDLGATIMPNARN